MANIKISELTALTPPDAADLVPVVDTTAPSSTKRTTVGEVVGIINGDVDVADDGTATISELPVSKLKDGAARQLLQTDAAGTGVEWTSNVDVPGTLDVTSTATLDGTLNVAGLASLDGGIDVDGAFTVANTSGNIATSGTLGVTGQSTLASAAVSDLTSGRVVLAGTSGELEDSAALTFNGTQLDVDGNVAVAGAVVFEGSTADDYETTLAVNDPTADRTITLPDVSGTVVTTGDTGTVTSAMIANGTIVDADVNASAAIAGTKVNPNFGSQDVVTTGNLGAGTDAPGMKAHLKGPNGVGVRYENTTTTNSLYATLEASDEFRFNIEGSGFYTWYAAGGEKFRVANDGSVSIGYSSPNTLFHVNGSTRLASEGLGGGTARNGIIAETSGTTTRLRWQHFDNSTSPYFAVDPASDSTKLLIGTNGSDKIALDASGRLLVGTILDSGGALLQINGDRIRIATAKTPASATDTGTTGEICWDADYIYVCTASNTWKRTAISAW